jgi:putative peptide-modifying radical SAM enzyme
LYCQNQPDKSIQPIHLSYDIGLLRDFILSDPEPYICFYGGDPLNRVDLLMRIMDMVPAKKYIIQTNGLYLDRLPEDYLMRIDVLIVSIDGGEATTDFYRGSGVYRRVLGNIDLILDRGFSGDIIARMAVSGYTDIYLDVMHLVKLMPRYFNYIHWQLDALWDYPPGQRYNSFGDWVERVYNPGISRLVDYWVDRLRVGQLINIIPFMGLAWSMLTGEKLYYLRCGSGIDAFAIGTDGRVMACPIAPEYSFNILGHIASNKPDELPNKVVIDGPCLSCKYYIYCGGRCLFANKTMLWGVEGFRIVCNTVIHLVESIRMRIHLIEEALDDGLIGIDMLNYPPYPNSIEVIP